MAKTRILLLSTLISAGACERETELFRQHFGESVVVTPAKARKVAQVFNWCWAASHLLSVPARKQWDEARASAWKQLDEAIAPARKQWDEAIAPAWKQWDEARASAWKQYNKAIAPARKQWDEVITSAGKQYDEVIASAFAIAYINDKK